MTEDEVVRAGVMRLKQLSHLREPAYELPADSFLEAAVCDILRLEFFKLTQENRELMDVNIYEHSVAEAAKAQLEQALDIAFKIASWCAAYPVDIFIEPTKDEWARANEVLKEAGISMTAMSASNMRHVVNGMKAYAEKLKEILLAPATTTNSAQISRKLVDPPTQEELKKVAFDLRYTGRSDGAEMIERCAKALGYDIPPLEKES